MKVTITIDNVREVSDIVDAVEEAYLEDHMENEDGELYRGHRQFEVLGFDMTYTSEETTD